MCFDFQYNFFSLKKKQDTIKNINWFLYVQSPLLFFPVLIKL